MGCSKWQIDISALLDGSLDSARSDEVRRHLDSCADCASFRQEQKELGRLLKAGSPTLEPPVALWKRIEAEITTSRREIPAKRASWNLAELFRLPQVGYGLASALLLLITALVVIQVRQPGMLENQQLAELDEFSLESTDNPFLSSIKTENPFFAVEELAPTGSSNPFDQGRSVEE
jgi:anti-sigma factor RsiW